MGVWGLWRDLEKLCGGRAEEFLEGTQTFKWKLFPMSK